MHNPLEQSDSLGKIAHRFGTVAAVSVDSPSEYRKTAVECYAMAERCTSEQDQERWERIGDRCIRRAMELERREEVTSIHTSTIERLAQGLKQLSAHEVGNENE